MSVLRLVGVSFAAMVAVVASAGPIYIEDNQGNLGTITTAGVYTNIGPTKLPGGPAIVLGDLAVNSAGVLYGTNSDGNATDLYSVNTSTGALTLVGPTGAGPSNTNAMTFSGGGTLYANDVWNLVRIDTTTGAETVVGSLGPFVALSDLAFNTDGSVLYGIGGFGNPLWTVDPSTGKATFVGNDSPSGNPLITGLVYTGGTLYGFGYDNNVYTIDTSTGQTTLVAPFSGLPSGWGGTYGAALAPTGVPALPAAVPVLVGLASAVLRRRRRS